MNLSNILTRLAVFSLLFSLMPFIRLLIGGQLHYIQEALCLSADFIRHGGHFSELKHFLVLSFKHKPIYLFLLWNLILAWVPIFFSSNLVKLHSLGKLTLNHPIVWLNGLMWLLFFPNAPYIITDFFHLQVKSLNQIPIWFDLIMIGSFSCLGFLLGFLSLWQVQSVVMNNFGRRIASLFAYVVLFLTSFGIYLGRFVRLNSWDFFTNPIKLLSEIFNCVSSPDCIAFTLMMFLFLSCCYSVLLSYTFMNEQTAEK